MYITSAEVFHFSIEVFKTSGEVVFFIEIRIVMFSNIENFLGNIWLKK